MIISVLQLAYSTLYLTNFINIGAGSVH